MAKIRVLIVDDAVVVRRVVTEILTGEVDMEVVGTAANGRIALSKITQVNPDIITLDVEMPEMDGLATLAALRKTHPRLPVIMFSTLTERGAAATLEALSLGASDYVGRPSSSSGLEETTQRIRDELIPRIRALCGGRPGREARPETRSNLPALQSKTSLPFLRPEIGTLPRARIDIVTIGVSTGGPNALALLVPELPAELPVPVVIVQHMPPVFTRLLAERLESKSNLKVREAVAGAVLEPGTVWIAPGNFHMVVERDGQNVRIQLNQEIPENSCRPAVDVLFRSVTAVYGSRVLGVILTGMGQDGLRGCQGLREAGGQVVVQDEASSVVWGMPGFVAKAGLAEKVLPIERIGAEIIQRVQDNRVGRSAHAALYAQTFHASAGRQVGHEHK